MKADSKFFGEEYGDIEVEVEDDILANDKGFDRAKVEAAPA